MNTKQQIIPLCLLAAILGILGCSLAKSIEPTLIPATAPVSIPETILTPTSASGPNSPPLLPFTLASTAFKDGETIPLKYIYIMVGQCGGENYSPPLSWTGTPAGTQSFAMTMYDPDGGNWVHWVQFNIPGDKTDLPEAVGGPDIGIKGVNSFHKNHYGGPCPPSGTHRYIFTLYALDTLLSLSEGATKVEVDAAMQGHILGQAQLTGVAQR